jgi:hypothetical protein
LCGINDKRGNLISLWKIKSESSPTGRQKIKIPGIVCPIAFPSESRRKNSKSGIMLPRTRADVNRPKRLRGTDNAG